MASRFQSVSTAVNEGKAVQESSSAMVGRISDSSTSLLDANAIISSTASQTNLLVMNAVKGFAVVADEIRKPTENSAVQSQTMIGKEIAGVQKIIQDVVGLSQRLGDAFDNVGEKTLETGANLNSSVEIMKGGMGEIARAFDDLACRLREAERTAGILSTVNIQAQAAVGKLRT